MGLTVSVNPAAGENTFNVRTKNGIEPRLFKREDLVEEIEDGEKLVTLLGYSDPFELTSEQYGTSTMIRLAFQVLEGEQADGVFSTMFGLKVGPKARLREVLVAALGRDLKGGEEIDFDALLGTRLVINTRGEVNSRGMMVTKFVSARGAKKPSKKDIWGDAE